jgi:rRNA biogenesis protein RRP5
MKGCFLRASNDLKAFCKIKDLSDEFIPEPLQAFPPGKLVSGRVVEVDDMKNSVRLTLKPSALNRGSVDMVALLKFKEGDVVSGRIQKIGDFGLFIEINDSSLVGLCRPHAAIPENSKSSIRDEYEVGDIVKAKILSISTTTGKVALGLKPSYFSTDLYDDMIGDDGNSIDDNNSMHIDKSRDEDYDHLPLLKQVDEIVTDEDEDLDVDEFEDEDSYMPMRNSSSIVDSSVIAIDDDISVSEIFY